MNTEKMICHCDKCKYVLSEEKKIYLQKTIYKHLKKNEGYEPKQKKDHHQKSKDEEEKLKLIVFHINTNTPCGQKMKASYSETFPDKECFDKCIPHGGRKKKYDLEFVWSALDITNTCEYKGSETKKAIDHTKPPWSNAVQGLNGTGKTFSICHVYAKHIYDNAMDEIIDYYNLKIPKPSYDEWIKDAFKCGEPITEFVCELRKESNKGGKGSYLSETIRKKYNKTFIASTEQLEILKNEVFTQANKAFYQKDLWLQINGSMNEPDDFDIRWSGKFQIPEFTSVQQFKRNDSDCNIHFRLTCSDGSSFTPILRWGYGQCISNIRLDYK